jgi:pimeloyl-ACP methyl ester carboxylesterase
VSVVGHSMGGMLAARFAASYPDITERAVLYDPIGLTDVRWQQPWHSAEEAYKAAMARTNDQAWEAALANIQRYFPDAWKPEYEKYARILYAPTLSGDWPRLAMVQSIYRQITYLDPVVHDWAHIKSKTLVLGGERDGQNFPALAKHIAETVPGAQLVLFPNIGHVPHIQAPEMFNEALLKFLLE